MENSNVWLLTTSSHEEELKATMKRLEHFLDRSKLNLNVEKSKTTVSKKGGGKGRNTNRKRNVERAEVVKKVLDLGWRCNGTMT